MKTLVCIQGHAAAQEIISLNLPFYLRSGCDLVGLEGDDSPVPCWPDCFIGVEVAEKKKGPWCGYGLHPSRLILGMRKVLDNHKGYDAYLWTECDSVFIGPVPSRSPVGLEAFIAGHCPASWNCGESPFLHPPFWMDRDSWNQWGVAAYDIVGNGTTDVLAALAARKAGIEVNQCQGTWSTNGLDMRCASKLAAARDAHNTGAWHIHGIKRQDHLDFITGKTTEWPKDVIWE